ncbi:hypothetical protein GCM10012275_46560 [Longimycelium tulufanense]|uniref:HTH cro/C1-type domain-containing protein n=1 Tax=Longimycelium tulufanense TaxID=907463 RepID=A0A8J3CI86_9PSEU|nr:helix-turn-helix transcriptional regulator [Longimycelium tulufanense]GGM70811.1 hypothetical protein GCM10012275_46560 [Longimycelium tulufanense]
MSTTAHSSWAVLRVVRKKDGHTQASLARAAGVTRQYVSLLERGLRAPTSQVIAKFAAVLNVPKSVLEPPGWHGSQEAGEAA